MAIHHLLSIAARSAGPSGAYVHDRRSGERRSLVEIEGAPLSRHELDDLYGKTVMAALDRGTLVLAGAQDRAVSADVYGRLATDARENGVPVIADLTGDPLASALGAGVDLLKISEAELIRERLASDGELASLLEAVSELHARGARNVLISRGEAGALARVEDSLLEVVGPRLTPADPRGTGDSMTAAAAVGIARGLSSMEWLRLAAAAGAVNATRHGLGTGARAEIEPLVDRVEVRPLAGSPPPAR